MSKFLISGIRLTTFTVLSLILIYFLPVICDASFTSRNSTEESRLDPAKRVKEMIEKAVGLLNNVSYREAEGILLDIIKNGLPGKEMAYLLLGRLYKTEGDFKRAEDYLIKASVSYPLLRDYALKLLIDVFRPLPFSRLIVWFSFSSSFINRAIGFMSSST